MLKNISTLFIAALFSVTAAFAQPKTVTDYFLAFPTTSYSTTMNGDTITDKAELAEHRRSLIMIEDIKNGYLKLEGPWEGWAEIALFKKNDGSYLVVESNVGCGPGCSGSLGFLTYKAGKWTDVTKLYAPKITDAALFAAFKKKGGKNPDVRSGSDLGYYFLLPRQGRTIRVACNECEETAEDFVMMEYVWNGAKLVKK